MIEPELQQVLTCEMRDPHTGIMGKKSKVRMDTTKTAYLEKEYKRLLCSGQKLMWAKRDLKRLAHELGFEESKIYKWCWERSKQEKADSVVAANSK